MQPLQGLARVIPRGQLRLSRHNYQSGGRRAVGWTGGTITCQKLFHFSGCGITLLRLKYKRNDKESIINYWQFKNFSEEVETKQTLVTGYNFSG